MIIFIPLLPRSLVPPQWRARSGRNEISSTRKILMIPRNEETNSEIFYQFLVYKTLKTRPILLYYKIKYDTKLAEGREVFT